MRACTTHGKAKPNAVAHSARSSASSYSLLVQRLQRLLLPKPCSCAATSKRRARESTRLSCEPCVMRCARATTAT